MWGMNSLRKYMFICVLLYCVFIFHNQIIKNVDVNLEHKVIKLNKDINIPVNSIEINTKEIKMPYHNQSSMEEEITRLLVQHHASSFVKRKFDLHEISYALNLHKNLNKDDRLKSISMMVFNSAQICLFDNFISHLKMLKPFSNIHDSDNRYGNNKQDNNHLVFPPLIIFGLDINAYHFCNKISNNINEESHHKKIHITCVAPIVETNMKSHKSYDSSLSVEYGDMNYREAVWLKPMLLSLLLTSQLFNMCIIVDVDIVFYKPLNLNHILKMKRNDKSVIMSACEIENEVTTANTGFLIVFQEGINAINNWTSITRFPPPIDDQASFRQKISRKKPHLIECFPHDYIKLTCSCEEEDITKCKENNNFKMTESPSSLALHCTEVPNKTYALDLIGLWHPQFTSHNDCKYGVSESWWKKHPKQSLLWKQKGIFNQ